MRTDYGSFSSIGAFAVTVTRRVLPVMHREQAARYRAPWPVPMAWRETADC
jgi:hypothetical protein